MKYIKVKDVTDFVRNGANIKQDKQCLRGIPITRIETISNSQFNWDKFGYANITDDKYHDYYLKDKDVLLSHINSAKFLGRSVLFEQKDANPIIHGMNLLCLRFKQTEYIPSFFVWYSKSQIANNYFAENTKKAVNQASITSSAIKEMPIPAISLKQQKKISNHLDLIQVAIDNKQQQLKELDELVKSRFIEMFGENPVESGKWNVEKWADKVNITNGKDYKKLIVKTGLYPVYGSGGDMGIRVDDYLCTENTVIIGRKGNIDKPLFVKEKFWNVDTAFGLNVNENEINPYYFFEYCKTYDFRAMDTGVTIPSLTKNALFQLKIAVPPLSLQNSFADFVQQIDKSKFVIKQQIKDLQELMDSKMQEYFGE